MKKRREQSTRDAFSLQTSSKFFHTDVGKITAPSQKGKKQKKKRFNIPAHWQCMQYANRIK